MNHRQFQQHKFVWIEGALLFATAPFLIFPTFSDVATLIALCTLALIWLLPTLIKTCPFPPTTPFDILNILWGLTLIIAVLVTADPQLTLPKITGLLLGIALWRYLTQILQTRRQLLLGGWIYGLFGVGFIFIGLLSIKLPVKVPFLNVLVAQLPSALVRLPEGNQVGTSANQLAGTLLFYLPLLISILISWRWRKSLGRGVGLLLMTLLIAGILLLTQSRTGWLGAAGSGLLLLLFWGTTLPRDDKRWSRIWITIVLSITVTLAGLVTIGPERLQSLWQDPAQETAIGSLGSTTFRVEVWRWAVAAVADFPFTGTGLGTFRQVVRRLYPLNVQPDYDIAHAHNIFLQTALDVGLPGLIIYLAILIIALVLGWQVAKADIQLRPYALGLMGCLTAVHIFGMADALALGSKTGLVFWIILGLLTSMHRITFSSKATLYE